MTEAVDATGDCVVEAKADPTGLVVGEANGSVMGGKVGSEVTAASDTGGSMMTTTSFSFVQQKYACLLFLLCLHFF